MRSKRSYDSLVERGLVALVGLLGLLAVAQHFMRR
jgi:hypothetical protein